MVMFKPGDVVCFYPLNKLFFEDPRQWLVDFAITRVSKCTHHGFMVTPDHYIEAANPGGVRQSYLAPKDKRIVVYRPSFTPQQIEDCIEIAKSTLGHEYDVKGAAWAGVLRMMGLVEAANVVDSLWFCSEHLAYIFELGADIRVHPGANKSVIPDDNVKFMESQGWPVVYKSPNWVW